MEMLKGKVNEIVAGMKDEVLNGIAAEIQRNTSGMNEEAMEDVWGRVEQPLDTTFGYYSWKKVLYQPFDVDTRELRSQCKCKAGYSIFQAGRSSV